MSIIDKVPQQHRVIFADDPTIARDSFAMLAHLITSLLKGDTIENRILAISVLASFEFKANDTTSLYMACMRGLQASLQGCTIDQFLSSVALAKLDTALHPGLSALFLQGDKGLLAENLRDIESRMECEDQV